jgi:hypothetical protein
MFGRRCDHAQLAKGTCMVAVNGLDLVDNLLSSYSVQPQAFERHPGSASCIDS